MSPPLKKKEIFQSNMGIRRRLCCPIDRGRTANIYEIGQEKNLTISNGTLTSAFSSSKTEYDIKVGKDVNQIVFSFVMNSNGQSMKSDPCRITPDTSRCKLTVTAEDGVSTKTYSFRILHEGSTSGSSNNGVDNTTEGNTAVSKPNKTHLVTKQK